MREEYAVFMRAEDGVHEAILRTFYPEEVKKAMLYVMNWTVYKIIVVSKQSEVEK